MTAYSVITTQWIAPACPRHG